MIQTCVLRLAPPDIGVRRVVTYRAGVAIRKKSDYPFEFYFGTEPADAATFLRDHLGGGGWTYQHSALASDPGSLRWLVGPSVKRCLCGGEVGHLLLDGADRLGAFECADCKRTEAFGPDMGTFGQGEPTFHAQCECFETLLTLADGVVTAERLPQPLILVSVLCAHCGFLECIAIRELPDKQTLRWTAKPQAEDADG